METINNFDETQRNIPNCIEKLMKKTTPRIQERDDKLKAIPNHQFFLDLKILRDEKPKAP